MIEFQFKDQYGIFVLLTSSYTSTLHDLAKDYKIGDGDVSEKTLYQFAKRYIKEARERVHCCHCLTTCFRIDTVQVCIPDNAAYFIGYVCRKCYNRILEGSEKENA